MSLEGPGAHCLPGPLSSFFASALVITNWASFYRDIVIPGAALVRHLPIAETATANMESAVVFAPRQGEVAVVYLTRNDRVTAQTLAGYFQ